jgi:hypothetical protein
MSLLRVNYIAHSFSPKKFKEVNEQYSSPAFSGGSGTFCLTTLLQHGRIFRIASSLAQPAQHSDSST